MKNIHKLFNPNKFGKMIDLILPYAILGAVISLGIGIFFALKVSPADYQQGESVRIMYVHVPAAWMALSCYFMIAIVSGASLVWRNPLSDIIGISIAPIGTAFTVICLITGSLWGKPIWGTWWAWDARLTSVLVLLFLYIGYMALYNAYDDTRRGARAAGILALLGSINIPIIKFSVDWWNTLHQGASIFRKGGVAIDASMLTPLLLMFLSYIFVFIVILILKIKTNILSRKLLVLRQK